MAPPARSPPTYAQHLDLERETGIKHEHLDGVAVSLPGLDRALSVDAVYATAAEEMARAAEGRAGPPPHLRGQVIGEPSPALASEPGDP